MKQCLSDRPGRTAFLLYDTILLCQIEVISVENREIREAADRILHAYGLLDLLRPLGTPHVIGSYRMDMMAWNDLDIDIENEGMSLAKLHRLTGDILEIFRPTWYEAKEEVTAEGKTVWFHGFEAVVEGALWNVDLWFFDREAIGAAERYCDAIAQSASALQREQITAIKRTLIEKGLYAFDKYGSMDVYRAVLEQGIGTASEFLERYTK